MANDLITAKLENGDVVRLRLSTLARGLHDLRRFWRHLSPAAQRWVRQQFATQGKFGGTPWPALSPSYATAKKRQWGNRPLLVASGALRHEVQHMKQRATPQTLELWIEEAEAGAPTPKRAVRGATKGHGPIAAFHQHGTPTMPPRPLLWEELPETAKAEIEAMSDKYIDELLGQAIRAALPRGPQ